jgi:PAS domain-containing protein
MTAPDPLAGPGAAPPIRILLASRVPGEPEAVRAWLAAAFIPCEVTWVDGLEALKPALGAAFCFDLVLVDYDGGAGRGALEEARRASPPLPVVFLCAREDWEESLAELRRGAADCVLRDSLGRLGPAVRRALDETRTARLQAEAEVSRARMGALVRALLESTSEGILVASLAGRITAYNRSFMHLCGLPEFVMAPLDLERTLGALMDQFEDPSSLLEEIRRQGGLREPRGFLRKGADRILEGSAMGFPDGDGMNGLVFRLRDVTSREREATRLSRTVDVQRKFLEDAETAGVVLWHAGGGALTLSSGAARLLGLAPAELPVTVEAFAERVHPEERHLFLAALGSRFQPVLDLHIQGPEEAWLPTRWVMTRNAEGGLRGAWRVLEPTLDPARLLTAAWRRRWQATLAASFTRAFQAPVEALAGLLQDQPRAAAPLAELRSLLERVASLAGAAPPPGLLLDLSAAAGSMRPWAEAELGPGIRVEWNLAPGLPLLPADPGRLEPVLASLLRNAAQAMAGQGVIHVSTGQEGQADRARVFLEVRDEGPGIPPRVRARMFDPFFTTQDGAQGLGLTVVACVAESLGGTLDVETAPLRGAAFRLWLPVFPAPQ